MTGVVAETTCGLSGVEGLVFDSEGETAESTEFEPEVLDPFPQPANARRRLSPAKRSKR
jgi:hypothetical protein